MDEVTSTTTTTVAPYKYTIPAGATEFDDLGRPFVLYTYDTETKEFTGSDVTKVPSFYDFNENEDYVLSNGETWVKVPSGIQLPATFDTDNQEWVPGPTPEPVEPEDTVTPEQKQIAKLAKQVVQTQIALNLLNSTSTTTLL